MKNNYTVIGDHILIQLDKEQESTTGIVTPKFNVYTSDSGRQSSILDENLYLYQGTIIQFGDTFQNTSDLQINDRVYVSTSALTPHFQFFENRDSKVLEFTGLIKIPLSMVEAKITSL